MPDRHDHRGHAPQKSRKPQGPVTLQRVREALASGGAEEAGPLCDALILIEPRNAEALHLGGTLALELGRVEIGFERLRQAAMLKPRDPQVLTDFAGALERMGNRQGAETAFRAALTLQPGFTAAQLGLGRLFENVARDSNAAEFYEAAANGAPDSVAAHTALARIRVKLMEPDAAAKAARQAIALDPKAVEARRILGSALDTMGLVDEAIEVRQEVVELRPTEGFPLYDIGMTQMHHGRMKDAEASFREAIVIEPGRGNWHQALSFLIGHKSRDADLAAMERVHRGNSANPEDRMFAAFAIGKALDDIGDYDEAFNYFLEANRAKRAMLRYGNDETDRLFDKMKAVFTPERLARLAGLGNPDETPIFVLGMPRSGTSLVEQVLAAHPEVAGGGESRLVSQLTGGFANGPGFPLAETLDAAKPGELRAVGETYVSQVRRLSPTARFITDKQPGNFIMIGMIHLMLPKAKIIHCVRDPLDTCLSIFKNFFAAENLRFAYDLGEIGHYHRRYLDLMAHWHKVLPGVVYDIGYEDLVADFEGEGRRLVEHCGLDWRDENRNFYAARRSVQTASSVQVRRPIYNSSIGHAARYGERLRPLLDALGQP